MLRRLRLLSCIASCIPGTVFANEPSPPNVAIITHLVRNGESFINLENHENKSMILEVSPGWLSSLQFGSRRVTLGPGAVVKMDLGNLHFMPGRQTLHIISKSFDPQNTPAGMGPFLLAALMVSATEIREISYEDGSLLQRHDGGRAHPTVPVDALLTASPTSLSITAGGSGDYALEISLSNGFDANVLLGVSELPQGTTARFTPSRATPRSNLTVEVAKDAKHGIYNLTVSGTSGGVTLRTTVTLVIQ